jgi:hypothetical protein
MWIADHLRDADKNEIEQAVGRPPREVIEESILNSRLAICVRKDEGGPPVAVFGVADYGLADGAQFGLPDLAACEIGVVWMVATPEVDTCKVAIARDAKAWVKTLGKNYDVLMNVVWEGNQLHIKWLRYAGFVLRSAVAFGPYDSDFLPFYRITS